MSERMLLNKISAQQKCQVLLNDRNRNTSEEEVVWCIQKNMGRKCLNISRRNG